MNIYEKVGVGIAIVLAVFVAYMLFVITPMVLYADAKCLRQGYPVAHVTVGLEIYCSNLQGTVTVRVDKQ